MNFEHEAAAAAGHGNVMTASTLNAVERYTGGADAQAWLTSVEELGQLFGWNEATCLLVAKVRLSGAAQSWAQRRRFNNWQQFQEEFLSRFGETRESAIARLERCRQGPGESPRAFADRFLQDADRAGRVQDDALVYQFIQRLHHNLRIEVSRKQLGSIEEIVSFCNYWLGCQPALADAAGPAARPRAEFAAPPADYDENQPPAGGRPGFQRFDRNRLRPNQDKPSRFGAGRPFADTNNRPNPPAGVNPPLQKPAPAPVNKEIDDLTKRFERLELNFSQRDREKDREIRHLRHVLQQQGNGAAPQINHLTGWTVTAEEASDRFTPASLYAEPQHDSGCLTNLPQQQPAAGWDPVDALCTAMRNCSLEAGNSLERTPLQPNSTGQQPTAGDVINMFTPWDEYTTFSDSSDIDPEYLEELLASLNVKRSAEEAEHVGQRAPHKRAAINPGGPNPYAPPRPFNNSNSPATPSADQSDAVHQRMPRQRTAFNVRPFDQHPMAHPVPAPPTATPVAATPAATRPSPASGTPFSAAQTANEKGKELAHKLSRDLKLDGRKEANIPPRAVLTCVAGHLAEDVRLIQQGMEMAKQTDELLRRLRPPGRGIPAALHLAQRSFGPSRPPVQQILSRGRSTSYGGPACRIRATIAGREVTALVDTGASASAVTLDCMRRIGLMDKIRTDIECSYINADGRRTRAKGRAYRLPLGLGAVTTLFDPTITEALNYDVLLGNDVLTAINAKIDLANSQMEIRVDPEHTQVLELDLNPPEQHHAVLNTLWPTGQTPNSMQEPAAEPEDARTLIQQYAEAVYSLPPEKPNVPGWKRCISDLNHQAESCFYEEWIDKRLDRIEALEEQLLLLFADPDERELFNDVTTMMQDEAFAQIQAGLVPADVLPLDLGRETLPCNKEAVETICCFQPCEDAGSEPAGAPSTQGLNPTATMDADRPTTAGFGMQWWRYVLTVLTMPPESANTPGWKRGFHWDESLDGQEFLQIFEWSDQRDLAVSERRAELCRNPDPELDSPAIHRLMNRLETCAQHYIHNGYTQEKVIDEHPEYLLATGLLPSTAETEAREEALNYLRTQPEFSATTDSAALQPALSANPSAPDLRYLQLCSPEPVNPPGLTPRQAASPTTEAQEWPEEEKEEVPIPSRDHNEDEDDVPPPLEDPFSEEECSSSLPHESPDELHVLIRPEQQRAQHSKRRKEAASYEDSEEDYSPSSRGSKDSEDSGPSVDPDLPCKICDGIGAWELMLLCSKCNQGFHTFCLGLDSVPDGSWYCANCERKGKYKPTTPHLRHSATPGAAGNGEVLDEEEEVLPEDSDSDEEEGPGPALDIWEDAAVLHYLKYGTHDNEALPLGPASAMRKETKRIIKRAKNYYLDAASGRLYKHGTARWPADREVVPPAERAALIRDIHAESGHLKGAKCCSVLQSRYYWRNMIADIRSYIQQCTSCLKTSVLFKQQPELRCRPPAKLWERIHIDTMGPYPATKHNGNRYIFVAVCAHSKYPFARAFKELNAGLWCQFLAEDVFSHFGTCETVTSDQGLNIKELTDFLATMGIKHACTAAYAPMGNGAAEAIVKQVLNSLQRAVGDDPTCWDEKLPWTLLGLRTAKHSVTGFSPAYVMTGRLPVLPAERRRLSTQAQAAGPSSRPVEEAGPPAAAAAAARAAPREVIELSSGSGGHESYGMDSPTLQFMRQRNIDAQQVQLQLQSNILHSQVKQRRDFRKRHHARDPSTEIPEGSLVLMKSQARSKLHKGTSREGPYRLLEWCRPDLTCCVLEDANGKKWKCSATRVALFPAKQ